MKKENGREEKRGAIVRRRQFQIGAVEGEPEVTRVGAGQP